MDFELTEEQEMIREMVRKFAEKELRPVASKMDEEGKFPEEQVKKAAELGFFGATVPTEYEGCGFDTISYCILQEELSRVWASFGLTVSANNSLSCGPIIEFGTEEQKKRFLPDLAAGKTMGCYAQTEPDAGSDVAGMRTKAVLDKETNEYVINGSKTFITNGDRAAVCILLARTGKERHKGISAFVVDTRRLKGFSVGRHENKMGLLSSSTVGLTFENCRIPVHSLLGKEGEGFKIAMNTLNSGRINIAAQSLGLAQAAFEEALNYSKVREQFGRPISNLQAIRFKIAEMSVRIDAARLLTYKAAWLKDKGANYSKESATAKLFASEAANFAADESLQIHGGYGYTKEYPIERIYRDSRIPRIYEGTSEIQKIVISNCLLKKERRQ